MPSHRGPVLHIQGQEAVSAGGGGGHTRAFVKSPGLMSLSLDSPLRTERKDRGQMPSVGH